MSSSVTFGERAAIPWPRKDYFKPLSILSADRGTLSVANGDQGQVEGPREYFGRTCRVREFSREQFRPQIAQIAEPQPKRNPMEHSRPRRLFTLVSSCLAKENEDWAPKAKPGHSCQVPLLTRSAVLRAGLRREEERFLRSFSRP